MMKIVSSNHSKQYPVILKHTKPGQCVEFEDVFNGRHEDNAKFLVLNVPSGYVAEEARRRNGYFRVMVANLHTGLTSLVKQDRYIRIVDAEVVLND